MRKIVYFDEGSATDILLVEHGGQIASINEETGSVSLKGSAEGSVDIGAGTGFLNIVKAAFSTKVSVGSSHSKDSLVTKTVSNTILTDFLNIKQLLEDEKKIEVLEGYKVFAMKDSFAYLKMYAPYMKVFKDNADALEVIKDLNIQNINDVLAEAKGYYELLAYKGNEKVVLRFNINSFKNAYMLTDLPKMNLIYMAIEVGECEERELNVEYELAGHSPLSQGTLNVNTLMDREYNANVDSTKLKLFDVILGGIGAVQDEN